MLPTTYPISTFLVSNTTSLSQTSRALPRDPFHSALAMQEDCNIYLIGKMKRHPSLVEIHSGCSFLPFKPLVCRHRFLRPRGSYILVSPLETAGRPKLDTILRRPIQTTYFNSHAPLFVGCSMRAHMLQEPPRQNKGCDHRGGAMICSVM